MDFTLSRSEQKKKAARGALSPSHALSLCLLCYPLIRDTGFLFPLDLNSNRSLCHCFSQISDLLTWVELYHQTSCALSISDPGFSLPLESYAATHCYESHVFIRSITITFRPTLIQYNLSIFNICKDPLQK